MRTKILATLGPATESEEQIRELVNVGVRILRLNFSHGGAEKFEPIIERIRKVEADTDTVITIMQDLSGPKIRTADSDKPAFEVHRDDMVLMGLPEDEQNFADDERPYVGFEHKDLLADLNPGDSVALSDGMLRFVVEDKPGRTTVAMRTLSGGVVPPRKGITFPGKTTPLPALTAKDRKDLADGVRLGVDAVAMSYVQGPEDIADLRSAMKSLGVNLPIIAKLERQNAVQSLERILELTDAVMVARGDLGLEAPLASLPALQKRIINACNERAKPVIVATQMLLSMVNAPMPTRAETTDVANAILDGADCLMLSEETAIGRHPVEAVSYMRQIARQAEEYFFENNETPVRPEDQSEVARYLAYSACLLANTTRAKAIVTHSISGASARIVSACRPRQPIHGLSPDDRSRHFMNFSWGVEPHVVDEKNADHLKRAEAFVNDAQIFAEDDTVIITAGQPKPDEMRSQTNVVKVYTR